MLFLPKHKKNTNDRGTTIFSFSFFYEGLTRREKGKRKRLEVKKSRHRPHTSEENSPNVSDESCKARHTKKTRKKDNKRGDAFA